MQKLFADLFGAIVSLILLLFIASKFLDFISEGGQKTDDEIKRELTQKCNEVGASAVPQGVDKNHFVSNCIQGGLLQLKKEGRIK